MTFTKKIYLWVFYGINLGTQILLKTNSNKFYKLDQK